MDLQRDEEDFLLCEGALQRNDGYTWEEPIESSDDPVV